MPTPPPTAEEADFSDSNFSKRNPEDWTKDSHPVPSLRKHPDPGSHPVFKWLNKGVYAAVAAVAKRYYFTRRCREHAEWQRSGGTSGRQMKMENMDLRGLKHTTSFWRQFSPGVGCGKEANLVGAAYTRCNMNRFSCRGARSDTKGYPQAKRLKPMKLDQVQGRKMNFRNVDGEVPVAVENSRLQKVNARHFRSGFEFGENGPTRIDGYNGRKSCWGPVKEESVVQINGARMDKAQVWNSEKEAFEPLGRGSANRNFTKAWENKENLTPGEGPAWTTKSRIARALSPISTYVSPGRSARKLRDQWSTGKKDRFAESRGSASAVALRSSTRAAASNVRDSMKIGPQETPEHGQAPKQGWMSRGLAAIQRVPGRILGAMRNEASHLAQGAGESFRAGYEAGGKMVRKTGEFLETGVNKARFVAADAVLSGVDSARRAREALDPDRDRAARLASYSNGAMARKGASKPAASKAKAKSPVNGKATARSKARTSVKANAKVTAKTKDTAKAVKTRRNKVADRARSMRSRHAAMPPPSKTAASSKPVLTPRR